MNEFEKEFPKPDIMKMDVSDWKYAMIAWEGKKEGEEIDLLLDENDQIINVEIPIFVQLEVIETEPGFKGDTATNITKPAKVETGAMVNVPLFVNEGDLLRIDTRTGDYMERVKN